MNDGSTHSFSERALTDEERLLATWMLEHGEPEALSFLSQVAHASVVGGCKCGCASIDFAVDGHLPPLGGLQILGDYLFGSEADLSGVFIFAKGGVLAGLEVYGLASDAPSSLPHPSSLRSFNEPSPG